MVHQHHSTPIPRRRHPLPDGAKVIKPRRHRLLPALAFLTLNKESLSLILPRQPFFSGQYCSIQPLVHGFHYCHRRRKRSLFESQLQFTSNQDNARRINPKIPCNFSTLSPSSLLAHSQKCIPPVSHPIPDCYGRCNGAPSRSSTTLSMTQSSEPTDGSGKNHDRKKKGGGGDSGGGPKPKANKGVAKGASAPGSGAAGGGDRAGGKTKRTRRRNGKTKTNNAKRQGRPKSSGGKGRAKPKAATGNDADTLHTNKSSIKTSGENNSLKGFKSRSRPLSPKKIEEQTVDIARGNVEESVGGENGLQKRVVQLEMIVSKQQFEIQKLRREMEDLAKAASVFSNVVDVLREAGLRIDEGDDGDDGDESADVENDEDAVGVKENSLTKRPLQQHAIHDDMEIFGIAPKSVTDAADAAGASILSAILAGKHRMMVDVRDAELARDPKLFVEFIELAILPAAAGLEGLDNGDEYVRNRVKIVFPTVKGLMSYRRSMALAAPEVVSLSTLGFDPVDERDNLIVVVAPSPEDAAGVDAMERFMSRTDRNHVEPDQRISQPVVVLNHHMVPIDMNGFGKFTSVYHLRLLSVQYMTGDSMPEYVAKERIEAKFKEGSKSVNSLEEINKVVESEPSEGDKQNSTDSGMEAKQKPSDGGDEEDAALEAAMTHAHEIGVHQGITRAMVIRAYPKPWHVFVDTSPDTDADFEVAATFDAEPSQEDVNYAIVECLEGSEKEDEIVAQQMQAALEAGQLNRVSDMLGISPSDIVAENKGHSSEVDEGNGEDDKYDGNDDSDELYYDDWFSEDSV